MKEKNKKIIDDVGLRISFNIKKIMKEKNMNQTILSKKLDKTAENTSAIFTRLEQGTSSLKTLKKIAEALEVDIFSFFY